MIEGIPAWLLRLYGGSALGELYPFLMQRARWKCAATITCLNQHASACFPAGID
jgi:hypothetical protein